MTNLRKAICQKTPARTAESLRFILKILEKCYDDVKS